jgi:hypothetical protein
MLWCVESSFFLINFIFKPKCYESRRMQDVVYIPKHASFCKICTYCEAQTTSDRNYCYSNKSHWHWQSRPCACSRAEAALGRRELHLCQMQFTLLGRNDFFFLIDTWWNAAAYNYDNFYLLNAGVSCSTGPQFQQLHSLAILVIESGLSEKGLRIDEFNLLFCKEDVLQHSLRSCDLFYCNIHD